MTHVATSLTPMPFLVWVGALLRPRKVYQPSYHAVVTSARSTTGAPNDGEHPSDSMASPGSYYAYLPLFVP